MIITEGAAQGLERCRRCLLEKSPQASNRAGQAIAQKFELLETMPELGRPVEDLPELREPIIPFGSTGYVALYRHDPGTDTVYVLAFRQQKEAGYR